MKKSRTLASVVICIVLVSIPLVVPTFMRAVYGQTPADTAAKFAPLFHFTSGERFYPTSVDYLIGSSTLKQRMSNGSSVLVDPAPTTSNLGTYNSSDYFLDNKSGTLEGIANDYASKVSTLGYKAYVRVATAGSSTVVEYWLFYIYNNGPLNDHQGDIEVVQVFLDSSGNAQRALYSQHGSGENAVWSDVEKSDTHPIVYVAQGSHANYFRPYQGKIGIENDIVGSVGLTLAPTDLSLVILGDKGSHPSDQSWLDFPGRWGYWGTDEEVAAGKAGPLGPVFNQNGDRWAQPNAYLGSTLIVNGTYFILAWLMAYFLIIVAVYIGIRAIWKVLGIVRLNRGSGLLVKGLVRGKALAGLSLGIAAILVTVAALFLPWYTITASSQSGALSQAGGVTLLKVDGINGMQVNLFLGSGSDSTSGFTSLFFLQIPFAILIAAGVVLLALDVIGVRSGKKLGTKLIFGAISSLLPFILIYVFILELPSFLPLASGLLPGQNIPPQLDSLVHTIAGMPILGSASQAFPVIGTTTVNWGYGLGAYMFVLAAALRIVGGLVLRGSPDLQAGKIRKSPGPSPSQAPMATPEEQVPARNDLTNSPPS